ncbi:hypothetical protein RRSWK_07187 [Rhodopirellula sp. SWK7]|nr:hypothetical protein RRSWK_07187 [Rhodopirellula sp. SWK7]
MHFGRVAHEWSDESRESSRTQFAAIRTSKRLGEFKDETPISERTQAMAEVCINSSVLRSIIGM